MGLLGCLCFHEGIVSEQEVAGILILIVYLEVNFSFQVSGLHVSFCYLYDNPLFFVCSRKSTVKYVDVGFSCIFRGPGATLLISDLFSEADDILFTEAIVNQYLQYLFYFFMYLLPNIAVCECPEDVGINGRALVSVRTFVLSIKTVSGISKFGVYFCIKGFLLLYICTYMIAKPVLNISTKTVETTYKVNQVIYY